MGRFLRAYTVVLEEFSSHEHLPALLPSWFMITYFHEPIIKALFILSAEIRTISMIHVNHHFSVVD